MWVLVSNLPVEINVVLQNLRDTKFYKIYDVENRYIGNGKVEIIEKKYLKVNGNRWIKKEYVNNASKK